MRIKLSGDLTYREARLVMARVVEQLAVPETVLDLAEVNEVDSSAIALVLAWLRRAEEQSIVLRCENVPANLRSLAALYGVEAIVPID
ncbi:STAS domain-containing protein [Chitinivorax sp. PXF-14]|uniref:STAS domain-containing protein n=1 Tax=Chitinivorax sp. PXF-14 TaxID=3230488 RepID=UPI003466338C